MVETLILKTKLTDKQKMLIGGGAIALTFIREAYTENSIQVIKELTVIMLATFFVNMAVFWISNIKETLKNSLF